MPAFNLKPTLITYLYQAYAFGIMEQPAIPALMLEWNIQWAFPNQKSAVPWLRFDLHPCLNMPRLAALGVLEWRNHDRTLWGALNQ